MKHKILSLLMLYALACAPLDAEEVINCEIEKDEACISAEESSEHTGKPSMLAGPDQVENRLAQGWYTGGSSHFRWLTDWSC